MNSAPKASRRIFVLDAGVFIQSHRHHYAFDIVPGFWNTLLIYHNAGTLVSIDRIKKEVLSGGKDDALEDWVKNTSPKTLWDTTKEPRVASIYGDMMDWVQSSTHYTSVAKRIFATNADGWVAAYAKVHGLTLVTHEQLNVEKKKEVPLPNVCKQFDVKWMNTFDMLRNLNVRFS
ncbi:DUF4411 family protein [Sinimarinibacterium sp. NLF-5-8]|uniref:DUF4411 family protein n=1 Tax=Sinimarinibacterium sp. NLF-5-8 TaxID=2698684 RepID=UPI00137C0A1C|nr:DUF4411 family protein [Sinimarinibacterium sp. NLF-5-8]QHS09143.1 DUF4411 family protein [Sinimarinibacterium sp. NLF-5-8]